VTSSAKVIVFFAALYSPRRPVGPALYTCSRYLLSNLHLQPRKKLRVAVRRLILQLHGLHTRPRPRFYMHHDIHLMSGRVRYVLGRDLGCIEALFLQDIAEADEPFVDVFLSKWSAQCDLHSRRSGRIRRRWRQTFNQHSVEEKTLSNNEIELHSAANRDYDGFQISVFTQAVQRAQAPRNLVSIQRFPDFNRKSRGRFRKYAPIFSHNPYRNHWSFRCRRLGPSFRLRLGITPRCH
jgi:hypothetical protein